MGTSGNEARPSLTLATKRMLRFPSDSSFSIDRSSEASKPSYWEGQDLTFPDEGHVMQLAGKWSIDPTTLDEREADDGWLGETTGNQEQEPPKRPWWKLWR